MSPVGAAWKNISFILADSYASEGAEVSSFWGTVHEAEASERQAPILSFMYRSIPELLPHLVELDRRYRRSPVYRRLTR